MPQGLPIPNDTVRQTWGRGVRAGMYPISDTELYWFTVFNAPEVCLAFVLLTCGNNWPPSTHAAKLGGNTATASGRAVCLLSSLPHSTAADASFVCTAASCEHMLGLTQLDGLLFLHASDKYQSAPASDLLVCLQCTFSSIQASVCFQGSWSVFVCCHSKQHCIALIQ